MYNFLAKLTQDYRNSSKWVDHVKDVIDKKNGFSNIWKEEEINIDRFKYDDKKHCNDMFQQEWLDKISNNSQCDFYKLIKIRSYLKIISLNWILLTDTSLQNSGLEPTTCLWQGIGSGMEAMQIYYVPYVMITALEMKSLSYLNVHIFKANKRNSSQILFLKYNIKMWKLKYFFESWSETLEDLAKFAKLIMSKFRRMSQYPAQHGPEPKKVHLTRSGRETKPPSRLNL